MITRFCLDGALAPRASAEVLVEADAGSSCDSVEAVVSEAVSDEVRTSAESIVDSRP